ncbi:MAG: ribulose-phosphate 3-epimerase [Kiritimatiellaeota bacterium]|nr:ribulose-phosphate 3-epimerase [Kiritimatiellota bacterium]
MGQSIKNLDNDTLLVAPSILAADFADLGADIRRVEKAGADIVHIDVMDGHFVPNISLGPPVVKSIRKVTNLPFDTHLMISEPRKYAESFAKAGSDHITFHLESEGDPKKTIDLIRSLGCTVGICLKPKTSAKLVLPFLELIDMVLVMTVEPGFGGQSFIADMMPKVREIRDAITAENRKTHLEVDGGVDADTVGEVFAAGANMMVAGTSVFRHPEGAEFAINALKRVAE